MKKILFILSLLLPVMAVAQHGVGDWRIHPYYVPAQMTNAIDAGDKVYYLVGSDLFRFDKQTQENESLNKRNFLNDVKVTGIYYNYQKKYLLVTYLNSNIDIIDANDRITNLPDIKDAVLTGTKEINDVTFGGNNIYVATSFGYVVFDDVKMHVTESHIYGRSIASVAQMGDLLLVAHSGYIYGGAISIAHDALASFVNIGSAAVFDTRFIPVDEETILVNGRNVLYSGALSTDANGKNKLTLTSLVAARATTVQPSSTGFIASFASAASPYYVTLDKKAANPVQTSCEKSILTSNPHGDGTVWALCLKGLHRLGDEANYYSPDGIGISLHPMWMAFDASHDRLYLTSTTACSLIPNAWDGTVTEIWTYENDKWSDVTPENLPNNGASSNWQMVLDPKAPNTYVYPSRKNGVVKVTDGKIAATYGSTNSYFGSSWYKGACQFDSEGNLWVVYSSEAASKTTNNVMVLPRAKFEAASVAKTDWLTPNVPGTRTGSFNGSTFVIVDDVKVYNSSNYTGAFVFWKENSLSGTPTSRSYVSLVDQDGKSITWLYAYCMTTDRNGRVWVGLDNGMFAMDPTKAFDSDFTVDHLKVPRNDGTGLADYLLDGIQVNCIAVDGANRKWIGTNESGLFLVSPDGSKILKQFTVDNSYLPTNTIYNVCCNTNSNSVYVLTPAGFLEYFSDTTPAAADYSDVYVYPNPVRPDFTGLVTINGLMDNSLVKISDTAGNVIKQLRSVGGMATWDCCNDSGQRVNTGVYYVLASEKEGGSAHSVVAKFLVIK